MALSGSLEYKHSLNGTLQEPTSLSGELSLPITNEGNTTDYNALYNKPTINGVELQGNLTLEDLGIIVNAVKNVLINGASIVQNGVANIPIADGVTLGLVQTNVNGGVTINAKGKLFLTIATESDYTNRNKNTRVVTSSNYDLAVKTAMCDGVGAEWSAEEKAMAQERIGLGWKLLDTLEVKEEVAQVQIEFPQEYSDFMIVADISGNGNCVIHPLVSYNNGSVARIARQLLHSAYYPNNKDEHIELMFEKVKVGEDIYFRISGYEKTDYAWNLNKNIQTTGLQQYYDVSNTYQCDGWYGVNFARTITNATFKIFGR